MVSKGDGKEDNGGCDDGDDGRNDDGDDIN